MTVTSTCYINQSLLETVLEGEGGGLPTSDILPPERCAFLIFYTIPLVSALSSTSPVCMSLRLKSVSSISLVRLSLTSYILLLTKRNNSARLHATKIINTLIHAQLNCNM